MLKILIALASVAPAALKTLHDTVTKATADTDQVARAETILTGATQFVKELATALGK